MGQKKGRRVRKIKVPTDSVPEFELGETAVDIQRRREEREARKREEAQQEQGGGGKEGGGKSKGNTLARGGTCRKKA